MKITPIRRLVVVVPLVLGALGCTAPAGGASAVPSEPAATVVASAAPATSPAASGGGKYGDEAKPADEYGDEYMTPAP